MILVENSLRWIMNWTGAFGDRLPCLPERKALLAFENFVFYLQNAIGPRPTLLFIGVECTIEVNGIRMGKKEYSEDDIQSLSQSEWYKQRVFGNATIDPLYVIMGFLQEYFGGYVLRKDVVDSFFVNEFEKAQTFKTLCQYFLRTSGLEDDVVLTKGESGHSSVASELICTKLAEQFMVSEKDFGPRKGYRLPPENDLFKTAEELYGNRDHFHNFKRYSYLLGIIVKNKLEDRPAVNFANAGHKAQLAIDIFREFDAFGDQSIRVDYFFGVPRVTRITLSEENLIWAEIEEFKTQIGLG